LFLARISYGRSMREFILGAMLAPSAMCFAWFSGTGGSALLMEVDGSAGGRILAAEHAFRIYAAVDVMLGPGPAFALKTVLVLLFLVLIVASSTAAIIAIKSIGAAGSEHAETPFHSMMWAVVIAVITGTVMAVGGVHSIRDVMIIGAVPFSGIMALMIASTLLMIREADRPGPGV
jgi:choline-glycine betaine transporter